MVTILDKSTMLGWRRECIMAIIISCITVSLSSFDLSHRDTYMSQM